MLRDIREVAPTIYLAAPRAWDNMLTRIQIGMANSTPFKRRLYDYFMPRAIERERKRLAGKSPARRNVSPAIWASCWSSGRSRTFSA